MGAVAWAAHALIPDLPWEAAFVLGAIVSPTDPLAAATIMRRLDAPRRMVSAVEGEGLFNDATALVAYRVAVAAVVAGSFSLADAGLEFVLGAAGGRGDRPGGRMAGREIRRRTADAQVSITISLLTGYAAFVPADAIDASGVLATVTAGIYMGIRGPQILPPRARLQGYFVWDILDFVVNAILFVLIGLQLRADRRRAPGVLGRHAGRLRARRDRGGHRHPARLVLHGPVPDPGIGPAARAASAARGRGLAHRVGLERDARRRVARRGAGAPAQTDAGDPFPQRDLIIFLTFAVIFFTLVVQGLSLPALVRRLGISDEGAEATEELRGRLVATKAALDELDALAGAEWTRDETIERMRAMYEYRKRRFAARAGKIEDDGYEDRSLAYQQIVQLVLAAQRDSLLRMRSDGKLSNEAMNRILRELDLEESRLEI